ncbi:MAG: ATP-binding protein [Acidobacteria bacterium]|nr:ATP-binding protein [Acidobacteriota bacterium]
MSFSSWNFPFCPEPPSWELNWEQLESEFVWLQALRDCSLDQTLHAVNDDALIQTRMICEALVSSQKWRMLPAVERSILFATALLRDIAKPECTIFDPEGQISCRGHQRRGMYKARLILWDDVFFQTNPVPFLIREMIVNLIRYSGLPVHCLDQADPARLVIQASQTVRCDWLALLSETDSENCHPAYKAERLDQIELFREFCREYGCLTHPFAFASDHSRFVYFRSEPDKLPYDAYDTTRFEVVLLVGIPGAGKDTWILNCAGSLPIISLDELRLSLDISPEDNQGSVISAAKTQAREYLRRQQPFVWNATNIMAARRSQLIDLFAAYQARVRIVYVEAPLQTVLRRNAHRESAVPNRVIYKFASKLDIPNRTEAHTVHYVIDGSFLENWWTQWPFGED